MLLNNKGTTFTETVVVIGLAILLVGTTIYSIGQVVKTEGTNAKSWIDGINVPSSP